MNLEALVRKLSFFKDVRITEFLRNSRILMNLSPKVWTNNRIWNGHSICSNNFSPARPMILLSESHAGPLSNAASEYSIHVVIFPSHVTLYNHRM